MTTPETLQIRLTSSIELMRGSIDPHLAWIEQALGVPLDETVTIEADSNPADLVSEMLLDGVPISSASQVRHESWEALIENWALPPGLSPYITVSPQRERKPNAPPTCVWDLDWQDCPVAFKFTDFASAVISTKVPVLFPPGDSFVTELFRHWFIACRQDAAKLLSLIQQVQETSDHYLKTAYGKTRLEGTYDWDSLVLDANVRRMVRTDFELFFQREEWFRQHHLPYRRGYLLWGAPGNGKSASIRVMASHPHIKAYAVDLTDIEEKNRGVHHVFKDAAENAPSLVILEDLDRAFPVEGKRTRERTVSFQALLNCLDGVGTQDGVIVVATANDPTCLDPAILKRPGRFDRVVWFRNPDAELRRRYYAKLNPVLSGHAFESAIRRTDGFSFAQLRETYIMGSQAAFEGGREVTIADVIEAIELHAAGLAELKMVRVAPGFVH